MRRASRELNLGSVILPSDENEKLFEIFSPHALREFMRVDKNSNIGIVHYTSAEAAKEIISKRAFWMRLASTMNDSSEVRYGMEALEKHLRTNGKRLNFLFEKSHGDVGVRVTENFSSWSKILQNNSYIASFSEHLIYPENDIGRLSMWRAYGGSSSVALVLNKSIFLGSSDALKVYGSPVAYASIEEFGEHFDHVIAKIDESSKFLSTVSTTEVERRIFNMYRFAVLAVKHPGFIEEREWRLIHTPEIDRGSPLRKKIVSVSGVPQLIYEIPLEDRPDLPAGLNPKTLIERVIIGPTQYSDALKATFCDLLREAGVADAESRVVCSDIPLRR